MKRCSWWSQMKNNCLQTLPCQGFSVININGSDPPTQCTITTIEIYSSVSKECLISVLLNKQSGRWSRQSEASARSFSSTSREDPYLWHVATPPPGITAIFNVAGSPGARVRPQTTDEDEHAATPVRAQTHLRLPPGRERQKALIGMID